MNFGRRRRDEPEINLIAFIDVLLVVLIFLMLSTTFSKFNELQVSLPQADAQATRDHPREIVVTVAADGRYAINRSPLRGRGVEALAGALTQAAQGGPDRMLIISADAAASHQSVITVLEAARRSGLSQVSFAAQSPAGASGRQP